MSKKNNNSSSNINTKEEKRKAQDEQSFIRSQKMRVARLEFAKDESKNISSQNKLNSKFYIGCSGWFYWDWRKIFYPEAKPPSEWFNYYSSRFKTVELNAPFYSWPTIATVKMWIRQAKLKDFVYTVKVNRLITHTKKFVGTKQLILDFGYIADLLGERMGCFLFQLPPSFTYTAARLKSIVKQLDQRRRNVIEFRHSSWWNDKVYETLQEAGIIFCSCSGPKLPNELIKTADDVYIRFHGVTKWYRYDYSSEELQSWVNKIKASKAKRIWVYFNNDFNAYSVKNADQFMLLNRAGKKKTFG